ncbi:MAG TPA: class I SAM-dependent methyltransferase [Acidimicrobiia bacterium]|nr:class I SAM-dependent methyltransferase [Acidimicrobiia bacterium]
MNEVVNTSCPVCGAENLILAAEILSVPVHVGLLWPTAEEARECPKGDVTLMFCRSCGYLHNFSFDGELLEYGVSYDNALHFSEVFQEYELALAKRLVDRYSLEGKRIVEIGCGSAHFLGLLCHIGGNSGVGFDPSHDPKHLDDLAKGRVVVRQEYFTNQSAVEGADLICARHVLEHLPHPAALLQTIREAIGQGDTVLYFEVPSALSLLQGLSIWDVVYEHCGYYTAGSLERLFRLSGFDVIDVDETYGGQFLGIEARSGGDSTLQGMAPEELGRMTDLVAKFSDEIESKREHWDAALSHEHESGSRVVVWGAGGKGLGFMNLLSKADHVHALVDVNPRKQGTFMAGTGHRIVAPEELKELRPDLIVVVNPLYTEEITAILRDLGLARTRVRTV